MVLRIALLYFFSISTIYSQIFEPIQQNHSENTLLLPKYFQYDILFTESIDQVIHKNGVSYSAKGRMDYLQFIPINKSSMHGYLYVNHESWGGDIAFNGGGASILEIQLNNDKWKQIGNIYSIDFTSVGGTLINCGGSNTPYGSILSAEEIEPKSNLELFNALKYQDTSDFQQLKRYQNFGWIVEIDPALKQAKRKLYQMGRFMHEDIHIMNDGKTVYLTDDHTPSVFFKFIAIDANDLSNGQLYAFKETAVSGQGVWIELPNHIDSLIEIRNVAIRMGATLYIRHEWIVWSNNKIYISETGADQFNPLKYITMGGKMAAHLQILYNSTLNIYEDPYGRIMEFDPQSNIMRVLLEGGNNEQDQLNFANPDGLTIFKSEKTEYLVIQEDIQSTHFNKSSNDLVYNEIYFLDLSLLKPELNDLKRFLITPKGAEPTGCIFTPDQKTMFLSIQHPAIDNIKPFSKSCVVAIRGF